MASFLLALYRAEIWREHLLSTLTVFLLTLVGAWLVIRGLRKKQGRLPPGLPSLPVVGSLPFMWHTNMDHRWMHKLSKKYGPVLGLFTGRRYAVVLSSYEVIQEALVKKAKDFSDRPYKTYFGIDRLNPTCKGVIADDWLPRFIQQRHVSKSILKGFGFGRNVMESVIQKEANLLAEEIKKKVGNPINPAHFVTVSVSNVICGLIFGKHFDYDDERFIKALGYMHDHMKFAAAVYDVKLFPVLRYIPSRGRAFKRHLEAFIKSTIYMKEELAEHERLNHHSDPNRDFVSVYKQQMGESMDDEQLLCIVHDFFMAGTDTTANSLKFAFIYMANNPAVQAKVHQEIENVVGSYRRPSLEDRPSMPYVEAVLLETLRYGNVLPLALPHFTARDTEVGGYFIPAETEVFVNLWAVHMNEKEWDNPAEFNPDRFLSEEGTVIHKDRIMPFSIGRRSCLGELLAKQELFLFFTSLLQSFNIGIPTGIDRVSQEQVFGITMSPKDFEVVFTARE